MPDVCVIREIRGSTASFVVAGEFDGACAWDLTARLSREPLGEIVIDFSRVDNFVDHAIATVANGILSMTGKTVQLRGLRQHQERVFKCFGVDVAKLSRVTAAVPQSALHRVRPLDREVG